MDDLGRDQVDVFDHVSDKLRYFFKHDLKTEDCLSRLKQKITKKVDLRKLVLWENNVSRCTTSFIRKLYSNWPFDPVYWAVPERKNPLHFVVEQQKNTSFLKNQTFQTSDKNWPRNNGLNTTRSTAALLYDTCSQLIDCFCLISVFSRSSNAVW